MKQRRRVVHSYGKQRWQDHLRNFVLSFTPSRFHDYWMNKEGARRLGKIAGIFGLWIALVFLWYAKDLPSPSKINAKLGATTTFFDRTGQVKLYEVHGDKNRIVVDFNTMPKNIKDATIAIEDKDFYKHGAFSFIGILRAAIIDVTTRSRSQGGSTITQQYVKNSLLSNDQLFSRKIKELILSIEIEQFYSKDDILKLYLNEIPYGNGAYGIEAACRTYFSDKYGKDNCASHLTLGESAMLASIPNAPSFYNPYGQHTDALLERQHRVLDLMADQGYISKADAEANKWAADKLDTANIKTVAINRTPQFYSAITAPNFVLTLQEKLEDKYGVNAVENGGWKVITTLDATQQTAAEKAIKDNMPHINRLGGSNSAIVSADPKTGQVLSMVGSYDFSASQFNVATAPRQPGSSFKPYVYATLFSQGKSGLGSAGDTYGPGSVMYDVKTNFGSDATPYTPQNFGNAFHGFTTIRQSLDWSLNIPAVKALYMAGVSDSITTAHNMGITTLKDSADHYGLSLVLGSGEVTLYDHVNAYESFANGGQHYDPTMVLKITDRNNKVLEDNTKAKTPKKVLDPQVAYLMQDVMSDNNTRKAVFANDLTVKNNCGNNSQSNCVHVGVKTGTTEHFNDAWTIGYTQDYVVGVWVGNNDNKPMSGAAADIAAPVWVNFVNQVQNGKANAAFPRPDGIKNVTLDKYTGRTPSEGSTNPTVSDIFPSWYKAKTSADSKSAKIDTVSGKLATQCTPESTTKTVFSSAITPEIPSNDPAYNHWFAAMTPLIASIGQSAGGAAIPTENDDVHKCNDQKPTVNITVKKNGGGTYDVTAKANRGDNPIKSIEIYFDDTRIGTQNGDSETYEIPSYSPSSTGSHTFKAVVTDAVGYVGQDSRSVNVTSAGGAGGGSINALSPSDGASVKKGTVPFVWTGDGSSSYTLHVDSFSKTVSGTTTTFSVNTLGGHSWYIESANGNTSDANSFTVTN